MATVLDYATFDKGRFQLSLGIRAITDAEWIEPDARTEAQRAEKVRLLETRHGEVFEALPDSADACRECLDHLTANLRTHHPDHPGLSERPGPPERNPLDQAGRMVQEDLLLMRRETAGWVLIAASLCFPARWRLSEKMGRPMAGIHAPVPGFNDKLARPVDRLFDRVEPGQPYLRANWSVIDDPTLFQPTGHGRGAHDASITSENAPERLHIRVERQTFVSLPESRVLVFGIKTIVDPITILERDPTLAASMAATIRDLPTDMSRYKSMAPFHDAVLGYLDGISVA
jgi:hypothetical protein